MSQEFKFTILSSVFVAGLIASNLLGSKVTTIFGVAISVGIFAYPLTFMMTDAIAEVFGKKRATDVVWAGVVALLFVLGLTVLSIAVPAADRYTLGDEYAAVFTNSARILIASIIAFLISQTHDIWAFEFWKAKTKGKFLWLRNNASTFVSQALDTVLFMFIAFYGVNDRFTVGFILQLSFSYWLFKIFFAAIDTPFVYALVTWLRKDKTTHPTV